jgi:hypothetical protein
MVRLLVSCGVISSIAVSPVPDMVPGSRAMEGRDLSAISTRLNLLQGMWAASGRGMSRFKIPGGTVPAVHENDGNGTRCHGIPVYLLVR